MQSSSSCSNLWQPSALKLRSIDICDRHAPTATCILATCPEWRARGDFYAVALDSLRACNCCCSGVSCLPNVMPHATQICWLTRCCLQVQAQIMNECAMRSKFAGPALQSLSSIQLSSGASLDLRFTIPRMW